MAVFITGGSYEEIKIYRNTNCWDFEGSRNWHGDGDLLRHHGISGATFYKWRSKYGGLDASELKRVKELEQQLSEYKTMVAELSHDNRALKNLIEKKL